MSAVNLRKGKVMLDFKLMQFPEGLRNEETGEEITPPHWRLQDPNGGVICWGPLATHDAILALMQLAKLGSKHATRDELVEAGIVVTPRPHIWTPDEGGDGSMATHIGERHFTKEISN